MILTAIDMFVSNEHSAIRAALTKIEMQNESLGRDLSSAVQVEELREILVDGLEQLQIEAGPKSGGRTNSFGRQVAPSRPVPGRAKLSDGVGDIVPALTGLAGEIDGEGADKRFLRAVGFRMMEARHAEVAIAREKTFEWIFKDEGLRQSRLVQWFETGSGIFWISGKPGSGKSTLMKFLWQHRRTQEALKVWAARKSLVRAKYFFWNAGDKLQKSQEGLLRSLLNEILQQCPELIPTIRRRWDLLGSYGMWLRHELLDALTTIAQEGSMSARFCFFIDGVDEYLTEPNQPLVELIEGLQHLTTLGDIKICLSSRPWTEFRDAFGNRLEQAGQSIRLEDLNANDIKTYVNGAFEDHQGFQMLVARNPGYSSLTPAIVEKAQGVFLWVFLVVRSLLDGVKNGDSLRAMRKRLESFPPDLKGFFQHMIDSVEPPYRVRTSQYFQLALAAEEPLPLTTYYFLEEDFFDEGPSEHKRLDFASIEATLDATRRRLDACSKGLLEVAYAKSNMLAKVDQDAQRPFVKVKDQGDLFLGFRVAFLHRSVKDFLLSPGTLASESFDPDMFICKAILSQLYVIEHTNLDSWQLLFTTLLYHAWKLESQSRGCDEELSGLLEKVEDYYAGFRDDIKSYICIAPTRVSPIFGKHSFLHLCAVRGLYLYTTKRIEDGTLSQEDSIQLLHELCYMRKGAFPTQPVRSLLRRSVKPNRTCPLHAGPASRSIWSCCLEGLVGQTISDKSKNLTWSIDNDRFADLCRVFLEQGADTDGQFSRRGMSLGSALTVREVVKSLLPRHQAEEILESAIVTPRKAPKLFDRVIRRPYRSMLARRT